MLFGCRGETLSALSAENGASAWCPNRAPMGQQGPRGPAPLRHLRGKRTRRRTGGAPRERVAQAAEVEKQRVVADVLDVVEARQQGHRPSR